jgi:hypothetical protein
MTTFAEQLKTLTTPELEKLEKILLFLARNDNRDFEELLAQIGATESALSKTDADLIGSRTYELEIYNHLDAASARKQAMQEFAAGKLHKPEKPIPRYRPRKETNPAGPTALAGNANAPPEPQAPAAPIDEPATPATGLPPLSIETLPDNVVPLRLYSKFFHNSCNEDSVW